MKCHLFLQVVKDHGPFIDFELLRNRHAHCSVFLSFLISNADPAPMVSLSNMSNITIYIYGSLHVGYLWMMYF